MAIHPVLVFLVLAAAVHAQHDHAGHGGVNMGATTPPECKTLDVCVKEPTRDNCTLPFKLPHPCVVADLEALCRAMPFMAGCSVAKACEGAGAGPDSPTAPGRLNVSRQTDAVCRPFNLVATVCKLDTGMSKMAGCKNYVSMCAEGSKVDMCSNMTGLAALPTTKTLNEQVRAICEAKPATPRCEECTPSWAANKTWGNCDLLDVYGAACDATPDLKQCAHWHSMCKQDPSLWACNGYSKAAQAAAPAELPGTGGGAAGGAAGGGAAKAKSAAGKAGTAASLLAGLAAIAAAAVVL